MLALLAKEQGADAVIFGNLAKAHRMMIALRASGQYEAWSVRATVNQNGASNQLRPAYPALSGVSAREGRSTRAFWSAGLSISAARSTLCKRNTSQLRRRRSSEPGPVSLRCVLFCLSGGRKGDLASLATSCRIAR